MAATEFRVGDSKIFKIERGNVGSLANKDSCKTCARPQRYIRDRQGYCTFCRVKSEFRLSPKQLEAFELLCDSFKIFDMYRGKWDVINGKGGGRFTKSVFDRLVVLGIATLQDTGEHATFTADFTKLHELGFLFKGETLVV